MLGLCDYFLNYSRRRWLSLLDEAIPKNIVISWADFTILILRCRLFTCCDFIEFLGGELHILIPFILYKYTIHTIQIIAQTP